MQDAVDLLRQRLDELARVAGSAREAAGRVGGVPLAAVGGTASQLAQLASWLYDAFVRHRPRLMRLGPGRYSPAARAALGVSPFRVEVSKQGRTPRGECRAVGLARPPGDVATRLGVGGAGDAVIRRENRYYADEEPVQIGVTYVPTPVAGDSPVATDALLGPGSIYARLEERGYLISRIREEITARMPTTDEAASLNIPPGVPVLEVLHTSYDDNRWPFEVTRFILRSDLAGVRYDLAVED